MYISCTPVPCRWDKRVSQDFHFFTFVRQTTEIDVFFVKGSKSTDVCRINPASFSLYSYLTHTYPLEGKSVAFTHPDLFILSKM